MGTSFAARQLRALAVVVLALAAGLAALVSTAPAASATVVCGVTIVPASGGPYPPKQAFIALSKDHVKPGETIRVTGGNFKANETIKLCMQSTERSLGTASADASGNLDSPVTIPGDVEVGTHTVFAVGTVDTVYDTATLTVESATDNPAGGGTGTGTNSGNLPFTGAQIAGLIVLALLALLAGTHLTRKARRESTSV